MSDRLPTLLRVTGILSGAVVTTVVLLVLLLWISFDARRARQDLVIYAKAHFQRTLRVEGDVQLVLWPRPALASGRMSLSEPEREAVFAAVQSARFPLSISQLILGRTRIVGANLEGLEVRPSRNAKGEWNFADLLQGPAQDKAPVSWRLERLRTAGARVLLRDQLTGRSIELGNMRLISGPLYTGGEGSLSMTARVLENDSNTEADLRADARYVLGQTFGTGNADDIGLQLTGRVAGVEEADARASIQQLTWQDTGLSGSLTSLRATLQGKRSEPKEEASVSLAEAGWSAEGPSARALDMRWQSKGSQGNTDLSLQAGRLLADKQGVLQVPAVTFAWNINHNGQGSQGKLQGAASLDRKTGRLRLSTLRGNALALHPRLNPSNSGADLEGGVAMQLWATRAANGNEQDAELRLRVRLADDNVLLSAQLKRLWPPIGQVQVEGESLDLDRLRAPAGTTAKSVQDLFVLPTASALEGRLQFGKLRFGKLLLENVETPFRRNAGRLEIGPYRARLYQGEASGSLSLDADGRARWRGNLKGVALASLLAETGGRSPVEGRLNASGELGMPVDGLLTPFAQADGKLSFAFSEARWRGVDFGQSLREFRPDIKARKAAARSPYPGETTVLMQVQGTLDLQGGQGKLNNFTASNPWLNLQGSGALNMAQDSLDLNLRTSLGSPAPRSSAYDLLDLRGNVLPLQLKGGVERPDVRLTFAPASASAAPASAPRAAASAPVARPAASAPATATSRKP